MKDSMLIAQEMVLNWRDWLPELAELTVDRAEVLKDLLQGVIADACYEFDQVEQGIVGDFTSRERREPDKDGWVLIAEQGSEFWVKDFKTTSGEQVIVYIDVYDDMTKVVWFGPGSVEQIVNNWDFEVAEISEENMILMAKYTESLGYPPAQPREGFYFNPWKIVEGKARSKFQDVEEILSKFSALSGFPHTPGIFYEEMEE